MTNETSVMDTVPAIHDFFRENPVLKKIGRAPDGKSVYAYAEGYSDEAVAKAIQKDAKIDVKTATVTNYRMHQYGPLNGSPGYGGYGQMTLQEAAGRIEALEKRLAEAEDLIQELAKSVAPRGGLFGSD